MRGLLSPLIKLCVFLIVTAFFTYALAVTISNKSFGSTSSYKALFTDATGLQPGDDVRIAGVRVGTVGGIKLVKDTVDHNANRDHRVAQVSFSVAKSSKLPQSAIVHLRYRNLVGLRYLEVDQGAGTGGTLAPGSTIGTDQTENAVDLTVLFTGFKPLFEGLNATQVNDLSQNIISALQGEAGALPTLLSQLASVSNQIADKDQIIGSVIDNLTAVLGTVADHDAQLSDLIVQLQTFISGLAADSGTISSAIDGVNALATSTAGLLTNIRPGLTQDITKVSQLAGNLANSKSDLDYFFQHLPPTVAKLIRVGSYGSWFNFFMCSVQGQITVLPNTSPLQIPAFNTDNTNSGRCAK